jgi:hypothetical protein
MSSPIPTLPRTNLSRLSDPKIFSLGDWGHPPFRVMSIKCEDGCRIPQHFSGKKGKSPRILDYSMDKVIYLIALPNEPTICLSWDHLTV